MKFRTANVKIEQDKSDDIGWFTINQIENFVEQDLAFEDTLELPILALRNS